jgi:predicted RNA-binding Zn-ribbon protein involved in translation (DUF1610 family)
MKACNHTTLELLPGRKSTMRCRHCHLTIAAQDLHDGFCPECFEVSGIRRYEFDEVQDNQATTTRYRCEACGAVVTSK